MTDEERDRKIMREGFFHELIAVTDNTSCFSCSNRLVFALKEPNECACCGGLWAKVRAECSQCEAITQLEVHVVRAEHLQQHQEYHQGYLLKQRAKHTNN